MALVDNLINRALENLGFTKEEVSKVKSILSYVDIVDKGDSICISININKVNVTIAKEKNVKTGEQR